VFKNVSSVYRPITQYESQLQQHNFSAFGHVVTFHRVSLHLYDRYDPLLMIVFNSIRHRALVPQVDRQVLLSDQ